MADQQVGNLHGVPAVHTGAGTQKSNMSGENGGPQQGYYDGDLLRVVDMRGRLATLDAGFYTPARLNTMTYNDMVYAIRLADNPTTVK